MSIHEMGSTGRPDMDFSRVDLDRAWAEQALTLVDRGFHLELGLPKEVYLASLPKFGPKPEAAEGRFDIPVLVDPRPRIDWVAQAAGVKYGITPRYETLSDWAGNGFTTPNHPYTIWVGIKDFVPKVQEDILEQEKWKSLGPDDEKWTDEQWKEFIREVHRAEQEFSLRSTIPSIRKNLQPDERGATILEGLFYRLHYPEIFKSSLEELERSGWHEAQILMVGSQIIEPDHNPEWSGELRLFMGRYIGDIWVATNHDPADTHPQSDSRPLVVAR